MHPFPLPIIPESVFTPPVELYHATFLKEISYVEDILDRFKVFEISIHSSYLASHSETMIPIRVNLIVKLTRTQCQVDRDHPA
jgi:hypothetical protein